MEGNGHAHRMEEIKNDVTYIREDVTYIKNGLTDAVKGLQHSIERLSDNIENFIDHSKKSVPLNLVIVMFAIVIAVIFGIEAMKEFFGHGIGL